MDTERRDFDIAVIGAGLSGASAAILAAQSGARVVLLESGIAARHKVCGEFLSPESRVQLAWLGVLDAMLESGALQIGAARVLTSARTSRAIAFARPGLSFSRRALDGLLWARAQEIGVDARGQTRVSRLERSASGHFQLEANGEVVRARFVICATGRGSKWGRDGDEALPANGTTQAQNGATSPSNPLNRTRHNHVFSIAQGNWAHNGDASSRGEENQSQDGDTPSRVRRHEAHNAVPCSTSEARSVEAGAFSPTAQALSREKDAFFSSPGLTRAPENAVIPPANPTRNRRVRRERASRFLGLKTHLRGVRMASGEVQMFPFAGGYCGIVEVEDGAFNTCLLVDYARSKGRSPARLWDEVRRENRALGRATEDATLEFDWLATGNVSFDRFAPARDGILRVGDAAGYIHPLSGDGMAMALRSGELAARSVVHALEWNLSLEDAASSYSSMWEREFGSRLRWAARLQPLFTDPRFTRIAQGIFDLAPILSSFAVRRTRGKPAL